MAINISEDRGPGDNRPPAGEATFDQLQSRTETLVDTANKWLTERKEIANDDEATKAKTFRDQLLTQEKAVEAVRVAAKAPHLAASTAVDAKYNPVKVPCRLAYDLVGKLLTAWLVKKQAAADKVAREAEAKARTDREAAEAAARAAEEAATKPGGDVVRSQMAAQQAAEEAEEAEKAAARARAPAKVSSLYGGRSSSLRTNWKIEIDDVTKIPARTLKHLCSRAYVQEALIRSLKEDGVDVARSILGVRVIEDQKGV